MKMRRMTGLFLMILAVGFAAALGNRAPADSGKKYKISVTGGYAVDGLGNVITEAEQGFTVYLCIEPREGVYVYEWKVNGTPIKDHGYSFTMPAKDVEVTPVEKTQTPYSFDLTKPSRIPDAFSSGQRDYVISAQSSQAQEMMQYLYEVSGLSFYKDYYKGEASVTDFDFDGDGTKDAKIYVWDVPSSTECHVFMSALPGSSIQGSIVLDKPSVLPYWPVTIDFGPEPVKEAYKVSVSGGEARNQNGNVITEAAPGQWVYLHYEENNESYLQGWEADGGTDFDEFYGIRYEKAVGTDDVFLMPAGDMTLRSVTASKKPYTIDFTKGNVTVPLEVAHCINQSLYGDAYAYNDDLRYDLDGDGTADVQIGESAWNVFDLWSPCETCSISGTFTLEGTNSGRYWPISFKFGKKKGEYAITVVGGHAEDADGKTVQSAAAGKWVRIIHDPQPGKYWKAWKADCGGIEKDKISFGFVMPARDVTITAETVSKQTPYTVNVTNYLEWVEKTSRETAIVINAALANNDGHFSSWIDLDDDGSIDFNLYIFMDEAANYNPGEEKLDKQYAFRNCEYSLGKEATIPVKDGPYGPITFVVDDDSILDPEVYHTVKVIDGYAETVTGNGYGCRAAKGDTLRIWPYTYKGNDVIGWDTGDIKGKMIVPGNYSSTALYITMPDHNITVTGIHGRSLKKKYSLDNGSGFNYPNVSRAIELALEKQYKYILEGYAPTGSTVTIRLPIELMAASHLEIKQISLITASNESVLFDGETMGAFPKDGLGFSMPNENTTVSFVFHLTPKPTSAPTPTPDPTSVVTPTGVPTGEPTVIPTEAASDNGTGQKQDVESNGGFNILFVIIPVGVILLAAEAVWLVLRNRRKPAGEAAVKEEKTADEAEAAHEEKPAGEAAAAQEEKTADEAEKTQEEKTADEAASEEE
ncbi:MAG: hypothetical protein J5643_05345 [Lachnospiraceae bacterium]|nr:hypothetical protein [Lachnospiraceae bacterium]